MSDILIARYDDAKGRAGKLKGVITFSNGETCKVWDDDLHAECQELAREVVTPVHYEVKQSPKWGQSLTRICRLSSFADAYDAARGADEQRGRTAPNSYLGRKIAKGIDEFDDVRRG